MATETGKPELRKDTVNNRWVIFSPTRSRRPSDFKSKSNSNSNNQSEKCPFCAGNEHQCAPEIFRVPADSTSDWKIRVIQNFYPALGRDIEADKGEEANGCASHVTLSGFGFHDVVIESPVHPVHLLDLSPVQVGDVLLAYKKRIEQLGAFNSIQYIQVFKNHGASAGASMSHSHSQIIALPVVPPSVSARLHCMKEYYDQTGKCSLCEVPSKSLVIDKSTHFFSVAPFAAMFSFEIWIIPHDHSSHFHEIDSDKAIDLGRLLKLSLQKISSQLNDPPYNFMIQNSPLQVTSSQLPYAHWYLQIVPQLSVTGGFEMGTGCYINPVFPEDAAKLLRELIDSILDNKKKQNLCTIIVTQGSTEHKLDELEKARDDCTYKRGSFCLTLNILTSGYFSRDFWYGNEWLLLSTVFQAVDQLAKPAGGLLRRDPVTGMDEDLLVRRARFSFGTLVVYPDLG